jgi:hypothetical protein
MPVLEHNKFERMQDQRIVLDLVDKLDTVFSTEKLAQEMISEIIKQTVNKLKEQDEDFAKLFIKTIQDKKLNEKYHIEKSFS